MHIPQNNFVYTSRRSYIMTVHCSGYIRELVATKIFDAITEDRASAASCINLACQSPALLLRW